MHHFHALEAIPLTESPNFAVVLLPPRWNSYSPGQPSQFILLHNSQSAGFGYYVCGVISWQAASRGTFARLSQEQHQLVNSEVLAVLDSQRPATPAVSEVVTLGDDAQLTSQHSYYSTDNPDARRRRRASSMPTNTTWTKCLPLTNGTPVTWTAFAAPAHAPYPRRSRNAPRYP